MRTDSESAMVRSLEKSFLGCRGSLAVAVPAASFVACVIACAGARYGVQLVPPFAHWLPRAPPCRSLSPRRGTRLSGPSYCYISPASPLSPSFHKSPMARSIEGKFFFPSMDQVKKYRVSGSVGLYRRGPCLGWPSCWPLGSHTRVLPQSLLSGRCLAPTRTPIRRPSRPATTFTVPLAMTALLNFDLGGKDAARTEAVRRFGAGCTVAAGLPEQCPCHLRVHPC